MGRAGIVELEALNQAAPADFLHRRVFVPRVTFNCSLQVRADTRHIFQQLFLFDDRQIFQGHAAGQRPSAESGSVLSRRNR